MVAAHQQTTLSPGGKGLPQTASRLAQLQSCYGNQGMLKLMASGVLQRKLTVHQPGDVFEQEADRVADSVMRMPDPAAASQPVTSVGPVAGLQRCSCGPSSGGGGECEECKAKSMHMKEASAGSLTAASWGATAPPPIVHDVLRSPGQPLDAATRSFMEPRFGRDFSGVRAHTDSEAAKSAGAVNALAYTVGRHVVFAEGQYAPVTEAGRRLIAHELVHTIQQHGMPQIGFIASRPAGSRARQERGPLAQTVMPENSFNPILSQPPQIARKDGGEAAVHEGAFCPIRPSKKREKDKVLQGASRGDFSHMRMFSAVFRRDKEGPKPPTTSGGTSASKPCVPTFKSLTAKKGSDIGVRMVPNPKGDLTCELILGTPHKGNGMNIDATVEVPASCTGTLQYVQLVDMCRQIRLSPDKNLRLKSGEFALDKFDPVDQKEVSKSGKTDFHTDDSPGQPVAKSLVKVNDSFKTWLLWRPAQPADAARIPLAMVKWGWGAEAKKTGTEGCEKSWTVSKPHIEEGTGKATADLPTWKKVAPDDFFPPEETKDGC